MYIPKLDLSLMIDSVGFVLSGLMYTLGISIAAFILGNFIGLGLTVLRLLPNKLLRMIIRFYISFLRGVPALVLLFLLYFGLPYQLPALTAAIICFSLTSSAFIGEIYRGALAGVDPGQWDAAYALGQTFPQAIRWVVLPQAFRLTIPALSNVAMDLVKGTSLAAMITVPDIFQKAKIIGGRTFDYMSMYVLVAVVYWLLCIAIGGLQNWLENYFDQRFGEL